MTREEILKLEPGPELNRLMAEKVMGWKRTTEGAPPGCAYWKNDDGFIQAAEDPGGSLNWSPSTEIGAMWDVVEEILRRKWVFSLGSPNPYWGVEHAWQCEILDDQDQELAQAWGDTACLAVCRAALLAVMEADNDGFKRDI